MSRIRGRDTKPELALRKSLHRLGFRFRLHSTAHPGKPDMVFPKYKAVIFAHGCFWHRHSGCRFATMPASNVDYWIKKFSDTVKRDAKMVMQLREQNWRVAIVWECALKKNEVDQTSNLLATWLKSEEAQLEIP